MNYANTMELKVTINRGGGKRTETTLPGQAWWTPTTLLRDLLDWLDRDKGWADIASDAARDDAAAALRALADQIEATKTASGPDCPTVTLRSGANAGYSPHFGTARSVS